MRVVVLGASGLIGQHVVERLRQRGHEGTTVARTPRKGVDHALDADTASAADLRELLAGHDGVVFAAGLDDRRPLPRPVYPEFRRANVEPVVRLLTAAREEGLTRAVVIGSYFTYFDRRHPQWNLAAVHPYIRSRVEQARDGRTAAGPDLPVAVLEVPFVFGAAVGRRPQWCRPLESWARSRWPLVAPVGGTAATSARRVGEVAVDALEEASGADIPVVEENLTWKHLLDRVATAVDRPRPVRPLPSGVVRAAMRLAGLVEPLTGRQSGLAPARLPDLLLRELHIRPAEPRSLDTAIAESLTASTGS